MKSEGKITGVEFYRRKRKMKQRELAEKSGVSVAAIEAWGDPEKLEGCVSVRKGLLPIANALAISLEQLLEVHDCNELEDGDRVHCPCSLKSSGNCVSNYRLTKNVTYRTLGSYLAISREMARKICNADRERLVNHYGDYVAMLADRESISSVDFYRIYSE